MRGRQLLSVLVPAILLFSAYLGLKIYNLHLVQLAVVNAVIQKAPPCFPEARIRSVFGQAFQRAEKMAETEAYRTTLFQLAQRLEKLQYLSEQEVSELLRHVEASLSARAAMLTWEREVSPLSSAHLR